MDSKELIGHLNSLIHLDIDAVYAYDEAIKKIDVSDPRQQLELFKQDHNRHVQDLSALVRQFGGQPPEFKADFKGAMIQGFTALRSATGTEGALKAMKMNEQLTNATYDKAMSWDVPTDVRNLVMKNRDDERRHLQYIEQAIDQKVWEKKQVA